MKRVLVGCLVAGAVLAGLWFGWPRAKHPERARETSSEASALQSNFVDYASSIQPLFDRRCVPCHACFDSPCQLNLQSFEGFDRGANKAIVYFPERAFRAQPTRMWQDAQTTARWQTDFGFFPVAVRNPEQALEGSLLFRYVKQRSQEPQASAFDVEATHTCPRDVSELQSEFQHHPERGMPFGFPPLTAAESATLADWLQRGAQGGVSGIRAEPAQTREIRDWEAFFNQDDPRRALVSAYLFEHLFYAHLYFEEQPSWFRLVRSRTPPGTPVEEIATRRPYDDPGPGRFYYRLRRLPETVALKTHAPYALSTSKLARLRELFYTATWTAPPTAAGYSPERAANPFLKFAAIPARARYQFMLDDAHYHVQVFIHGPVCRGQAALDVIDEQFLIFFLDPEHDPAITDPSWLPQVAELLALPAEEDQRLAALSPGFDLNQLAYFAEREKRARPRTLADIWHGDGKNPNAVLSVFRHYDNAFVLRGAIGGMPKTAWVMDYTIFERMYYDLVAGFDIYGNLTHQLGTRMYMNLLRIESEGQFLRFLPNAERTRVHNAWYRGRVARALSTIHARAFAGPDPQLNAALDTKSALIEELLTRELPTAVVGPREPIQWGDVGLSYDPLRAQVERALRPWVNRPGPLVTPFPDTTLLRVKVGGGRDLLYTIARNRAHKNIEFIFLENLELEPAADTLQVIPGVASSRPNLFLAVEPSELTAFSMALGALRSDDGSWRAFVSRYAVRRSDPDFWQSFDAISAAFAALDPIHAGVLDLSRYSNE